MALEPTDPARTRAWTRIFEKLERKEHLTPEESRLVAEAIGTMAGYLVHAAAKLVKPAIDRLAAPDMRASLDQLARRVEEHSKELDRHHRAVDAEHGEA